MAIGEYIKRLALAGSEIYLSVCTVDAVDEKARTVDCTPINDGAPLLGVNLQADQTQEVGSVVFPAVGSDVVVGFINPAVAVVLLTTEITKAVLTVGKTEITIENNVVMFGTEKVKLSASADTLKFDVGKTTLELHGKTAVWNGGSETTANASELQKQLNLCKTRIDAIIDALSNSPITAQDGGATYKGAIASALSGLTSEDYSNMIDDKIKH